jgi:germination protein M
MNLKKYSNVIIIVIAFLFLSTITAVIYNFSSKGKGIIETTSSNSQNVKVQLYFMDTVNLKLETEERSISKGTNSEIVGKTLEQLIAGPKNQAYQKSIPSSVKILSVELKNDVAVVNLSAEYNTLKTKDALFCRAALVYTLTNLDFIKGVQILVDGKDLLKSNGESIGVVKREDIVIGNTVTPEPLQYETVKLYFLNKDASGLIIEQRDIEVNKNQPIAKYIMEQLIVGPKNTGLLPTVPAETKIRDIKIKDGVCYVDLSTEFVTKHNGGSLGEVMTIQSIVNSLTEIPEIKKVQFLIEGEKQQEFKGHVDFSQPFERTTPKEEK